MTLEEAPREVTPPPLQAPSAKEKKYDRQLRLWAAAGQLSLEQSHVLLVVGGSTGSSSSVAGAETLKNLVLPSIGNFTIADSATVAESDLGVNFFLEAESLGKSRAEETLRLIQELNPDVSGHAISQPLEDWLPQSESLRPYNLFILCAPLSRDILERICRYGSEESVPVIVVQSVGLYSTFAVQLPSEFPIIDTHPDPDSIQDIRLISPWPELVAEAKLQTSNLDSLSDHDHGHVPYVPLLLYYLNQWKDNHNGQYPSTFREKTEFRSMVGADARHSSSAGPEENYDEACAAVLKTISPPSLGSGCRNMFTLPSCQSENLTSESPNFWIVANAIKTFHSSHGVLPLPGSLPDMKATSSSYIRLQNIYKSKARADVAELTSTVRATEKRLGRPATQAIPNGEIEAFAKNASHIKILHGQSLPQLRFDQISKQKSPHTLEEDALDDLGEPSLYPIFHYFALAQAHANQCPAATSTQPDNTKPSSPTKSTSTTTTSPPVSLPKLSSPSLLTRAMQTTVFPNGSTTNPNGAELHNISSLTGGMVAQEAIKLLTKQYVPVNNVVVYDGVGARMGVFTL